MNHEEILKSLDVFKDTSIEISALKGGLTNDNYLVKTPNKKYVARFAPENTKLLGLDRKIEKNNYTIASVDNIGPKILGEFEKYSLLIVEYIEGETMNFNLCRENENIIKVGKLFSELSKLSGFLGEKKPLDQAEQYLKEVDSRNAWKPENLDWYFETVRKNLETLTPSTNSVPCHRDIMLENLILTPDGKIKLIDWEFSANSDWRYDLAMYSVKAELDAEKEKLLLLSYGIENENLESVMREMRIMKSVVCLNETMYGVLQCVISKKLASVDYKGYALLELEKCKNLL